MIAIGISGVGVGDGVRDGLRVLEGNEPGVVVSAGWIEAEAVFVGVAGISVAARIGDVMGAGVVVVFDVKLPAWIVKATAVGR